LDLTEVITSDAANRILTSDGDGTLTAESIGINSGALLFNNNANEAANMQYVFSAALVGSGTFTVDTWTFADYNGVFYIYSLYVAADPSTTTRTGTIKIAYGDDGGSADFTISDVSTATAGSSTRAGDPVFSVDTSGTDGRLRATKTVPGNQVFNALRILIPDATAIT
jgi:hypothetical protein